VKLEIVDTAGKVVRSFPGGSAGAGAAGAQEMRAFRFGGGGSARVATEPGMHRFVWDLRAAGPGGGPGGPMVVPGRYQVSLTAGTWTQTRPLEIKLDPRVAAAGVSQTDLEELFDLQIKALAGQAEARQLGERLGKALAAAKADPAKAKALQALHDRVVTAPVVYPQGMLIDQFGNLSRMIGGAEQNPGKEAWDRYNDLMKEMEAIKADLAKIGM